MNRLYSKEKSSYFQIENKYSNTKKILFCISQSYLAYLLYLQIKAKAQIIPSLFYFTLGSLCIYKLLLDKEHTLSNFIFTTSIDHLRISYSKLQQGRVI